MHQRQPALLFIMITVLIDVIGMGLIIPILPGLIKHLAGSAVVGVQWVGLLAAAYAAMQFLFAPLLGLLSDRFGRRPVLLLSLAGMTLDYLLLYFAPSLAWLLIGRIIAGITGANMTVASAYIADVSSHEDRAKNFGMLGAAFGLGFIIGPALGGVLGNVNLHLPFLVAAALSGLNMLYGYFVLPESLPASARRRARQGNLNPFAPLKKLLDIPVLRHLSLALLLTGLAAQVIYNVFVLFTEDTLRWTPGQNGAALAFVGLLAAVVQAWLLGKLIPVWGERRVILAGMLASVAQFVLLGLSHNTPMLYFALLIGALGGLAGPAIQAVISKQVSEHEQGQVQGAVTSLNSLVGMAGPLLATRVYALGLDHAQPGAAFYMGAVLTALGTVLIVAALRKFNQPAPPAQAACGD